MEELAACLSLNLGAFTFSAGALGDGRPDFWVYAEAELRWLAAAVGTTLVPPRGDAQAKIGIVLSAETMGIRWAETPRLRSGLWTATA